MMGVLGSWIGAVGGWFGLGASATSERSGLQSGAPNVPLIGGARPATQDGAFQVSTFFACVRLMTETIASLPMFVFEVNGGEKKLARLSRLYGLLSQAPNPVMTPFEFLSAMILNLEVRGNAYARLDRDPKTDEVVAMWPMSSDAIQQTIADGGVVEYRYMMAGKTIVLKAKDVWHIRGMGNGRIGMDKLAFMGSTLTEVMSAEALATKTFANGGKPTGVLTIDHIIENKEVRERFKQSFSGLTAGNESRIELLEANMKFQQLSMDFVSMQLLEGRKYSGEEICRWQGIPPILVHHSDGTTTWGAGIEQIIEAWHKLSLRPKLVAIEQSFAAQVMTNAQRSALKVEFELDALLRGSAEQRINLLTKAIAGGVMKPSEARQLQNLPFVDGSDVLLGPVNLAPMNMLGRINQPTKPGVTNANN